MNISFLNRKETGFLKTVRDMRYIEHNQTTLNSGIFKVSELSNNP